MMRESQCGDTHNWEPMKYLGRHAEARGWKCRGCHQVEIVCPWCGSPWAGPRMQVTVDVPREIAWPAVKGLPAHRAYIMLCADCWQDEIFYRIDRQLQGAPSEE